MRTTRGIDPHFRYLCTYNRLSVLLSLHIDLCTDTDLMKSNTRRLTALLQIVKNRACEDGWYTVFLDHRSIYSIGDNLV